MTSTSLYTGIDGDNIATLVLNLTVTTTQAYDGVALVCFNQEFLGSTNINTIIEMEVNGTQIYNNVGAQFDEFVAFMAPFGMVSGSNNFTLYWTGASANVRIAQRTMVIFGRIK